MKMTMHIDEELLERVMNISGCVSKTDAVDFALKEVERKAKLREFAAKGLGLSPDELAAGVDPNYDVASLRAAETSPKYGKRRSGR